MSDDLLRTIRLYGPLGMKFGRVFKIAVRSPAEAVKALCVMLPGFQRELNESGSKGVGYVCYVGKRNVKKEELARPADDDIRLAPVPMGTKKGGLGQILLGAAIVVGALWLAPAAAAGAKGLFLGMSGGYAAAGILGTAIAIGGVASMLTPTAKGLATADGPDNGASHNFNGAVNTTAQGNPVPLAYGLFETGSATASAAIYAEDQQ